MHEIITIQLGQQSNYVATHFWNAQESYFTYSGDEEPLVDHDVHWRPGIGADGSETFMPRTVIYDLRGGFGSMRKINALYDAQREGGGPPQALWSGPTVLQKQDPVEPSAYQQSLDAGLPPAALSTSAVRYWSDFNRVFFHPRSVVQLHEYELGSRQLPFESWAAGQDLFGELDREHDLPDRDLRPFIEEADQMQGIEVVASFDDAWGGFAARYLERLRDEYGKTALWVWGLQEPFRGVSREKRLIRLANKARTLAEVYKQASLVVPVTVPEAPLPSDVRLDASSAWHTSALIAAAIESVTLPTRLRDAVNRDTLGGMTDTLNAMGKQNVAGLQMTVSRPAPAAAAAAASRRRRAADQRQRPAAPVDEDGDDESGVRLELDFSPSDRLDPGGGRQNGHHKPRIFSQVVVRRGVEEDGRADSDEDMPDRRLRSHAPVTRTYASPLRFPLLDSYPQIFRLRNGDDDNDDDNDGTAAGVTAALSTDASVSDRLKLLRTTVARSIGVEDREALGNDLAEMADEYHEGWSSGSDEGDDD